MTTHPNLTIPPTIPILLLLLLSSSHAGAQSSNNITAPPPSVPCGCISPPPAASPSSEPQPSDFPNLKQFLAYKIIQRFKKTITCDPKNITATWSGLLPCSYLGFFCETPPGLTDTPTIASVDFNGFRLCAPTLSGFLDAFPDLALFHANSNNFSGGVPDLSSLPFLYELDLSNNNHSGAFPAAVLSLPQLVFIDLRFNRFAGTVPASVFTLAAAVVLFLNNNLFSLQLPADIGESPVSYLTLANNAFTGPIPRSIGNASDTLLEVLFLNNFLSGCLPYEVGLLKAAVLFDAGFNRITGPIPYSFGCLSSVEQLNLAGNLLYGTVPDVVCRLAKVGKLENLSLSENYFTWVGHSCWGLIQSGVLDVRRNCIFGLPEQRPAAECVWFFAHHKYSCPLQLHIPCSLPYWGRNLTEASAGNSVTVPKGAAPANYMSYSERHQPVGN
ncbi:hypothetical protein KSP40_PGU017503 [Platanthera guangdongensis]|uniref:Leucine-rich repeat-containing N-terminal plant-type domain-containing protein n=1 Tax=Platanthera guangdongensis TaxID=2320717 RepID=A0ABR2LFX8_9ASPA